MQKLTYIAQWSKEGFPRLRIGISLILWKVHKFNKKL